MAVRTFRADGIQSTCANEFTPDFFFRSLGKGSVITSVFRISYSSPSDKYSRPGISAPSTLMRGVAVRRPRSRQERMKNSGSGSFSSHFHFSPPRRVSTDTSPAVNFPYSAWNGVWYTFITSTMSMGTVNPNWPVAGSVTSAEFTMRAARCSDAAEICRPPSWPRTTPGSMGSASATVVGRPGSSRAVCPARVEGVEPPASTGSAVASTLTLSLWTSTAASANSTRVVPSAARSTMSLRAG